MPLCLLGPKLENKIILSYLIILSYSWLNYVDHLSCRVVLLMLLSDEYDISPVSKDFWNMEKGVEASSSANH